MNEILPKQHQKALAVLSNAFTNNPGVLWVIKNDHKVPQRLIALCDFCLRVAMEKKGAYITSDQKGVALLFGSKEKQKPHRWLINYIRLGQYCIGWNRAWAMIKREREIVSRRPKSEHLYFWMLGVEDHTFGLNTIIEIRDFVFALSKSRQLPIYAETTLEKTLTLYKRYGFKVYDEWETGKDGVKVYFICRDWNL